MSTSAEPELPRPAEDEEKALQETLGYLNFSNGKPDLRFERHLNHFFSRLRPDHPWQRLQTLLLSGLARLKGSVPAFQDCDQAQNVIRVAFDVLEPAYRKYHSDLLFHLQPEDFHNPLFLARLFEAGLQQGGPWDDTDRIVAGALRDLNDFLGHRPVAVLESGQQMQPYPHERLRPFPLYIAGVGVAAGPYEELISRTLEFLKATPPDILTDAHFHLQNLDELSLDPRAHDHQHPMYKRTNYMFGEWDPHLLDNQGRYRRFVLRAIILQALEDWMRSVSSRPHDEILFEAAAVLCGTILMASTISGAGPHTYDSTVSLGTLLSKVARQRDAFYARLLESVRGTLATRLRREAEQARQPFGPVRQYLNLFVANLGSQQIQHSHLSYLFAKMGFAQASREEAAVIPANSTRFECEIEWRLTMAHLHLDREELQPAADLLPEAEDYLLRGIDCGALVDPWNILGFQGNFPLFQAREDTVADVRVETLLSIMEDLFALYSRLISEAAADGRQELVESLAVRFRTRAEWWDKFASATVSGLPSVTGMESYESAVRVAEALSAWHAAGESAGDITFWKQHLHRFETAKAYALVLETLLSKHDTVAAMGLLIQWLSQADFVGLESGKYSFHRLIVRWLRMVIEPAAESPPNAPVAQPASSVTPLERLETVWPIVTKLFDYLEANAGDYWPVPRLNENEEHESPRHEPHAGDDDSGDDGSDDLFSAAYENVVFRDSARDGFEGETLEGGGTTYDTDLDLLVKRLESRLKFQITLTELWRMTAGVYAAALNSTSTPTAKRKSRKQILKADQSAAVVHWAGRTAEVQQGLRTLMQSVWDLQLPEPSGDADSLAEFDRQLQLKFSLVHNIVYSQISCREAAWHLASCLPEKQATVVVAPWEKRTIALYRSILQGRAADVRRDLPQLVSTLSRLPLLYVPLDQGGHPEHLLGARTLQAAIRSLMMQLPRLGMFRETWHLLQTAQKMESISPRGNTVITEFDRLFQSAFRSSLEALVLQTEHWPAADRSNESLIEFVGTLTEHYLDTWLEHSETMRLSSLEAAADDRSWRNIRRFIKEYGDDFLTAQRLTLGNLRAILHTGVDAFLDYVAENEDPLHPIALLADLDGKLDREEVVSILELIFRATVEKYDRYVEYNSTTTQSDYGAQYAGFLDFLRVEASYERRAWELQPLVMAHEVLIRMGKVEAARIWQDVFTTRTAEEARDHLNRLHRLEQKYGMRLPSITNLLNERFAKPLTLDRIVALVPQAMGEARTAAPPQIFPVLRKEISEYLQTTSGSGLDVPEWLRSVEDEVEAFANKEFRRPGDAPVAFYPAPHPISAAELHKQFNTWKSPLRRPGTRPK